VLSLKKEIALLKYAFITTWRFFTGVSIFNDTPRISGHYYIRKPRVYERRNTRTKDVGYIEIIAEMPQARPASLPEYIVLIIYINESKRMRPRDYQRIAEYINRRRAIINKYINGSTHFFFYIICRKATSGVYEAIRRDYAKLRKQGVNIVLKIINDPGEIIKDLRNFLEKRLEKLLDKTLYKKSNYEIFARPKRLAEYMLILDALLSGKRELAEYTAQLLHHTARLPVDSLVRILYDIMNKEEGEIRSKTEIRRSPIQTPYI